GDWSSDVCSSDLRSRKWKLPLLNRTFLICGPVAVLSAFAALPSFGSVSEGVPSITFSGGAVTVALGCGGVCVSTGGSLIGTRHSPDSFCGQITAGPISAISLMTSGRQKIDCTLTRGRKPLASRDGVACVWWSCGRG